MSVPSHCIVCDSARFGTLFSKGGRAFIKCEDCGLVIVDPLPTPEELQEFYDRDYELETGGGTALSAAEHMAHATARHRLGIVEQFATGRLLDIGCSTGFFLQESSQRGFEADGIDLSRTAVAEARASKLNAYAATVETYQGGAQYDVVTAFDVMEHVLDPAAFLRSVSRLLKPAGILVLTTPDTGSLTCRLMGRRWYFYVPGLHNFHFDRRNITTLLAHQGFRVLHVASAGKALTYEYSLREFASSNPLIHRLWKLFGLILPRSWHRVPVRLHIGEMVVIARSQSIPTRPFTAAISLAES
jgi:2-polyprenyl-3-methyl-5-hydroxy-6-metoxy-1,4-benzoquinol methylase